VVYLETDGKHVKSRLKGGKRPLVQNGFEDWIRIYEDRKAIYEEVADITIDTSNQTLSATLTELKEKLEPK
jgi:shikimate kinase